MMKNAVSYGRILLRVLLWIGSAFFGYECAGNTIRAVNGTTLVGADGTVVHFTGYSLLAWSYGIVAALCLCGALWLTVSWLRTRRVTRGSAPDPLEPFAKGSSEKL